MVLRKSSSDICFSQNLNYSITPRSGFIQIVGVCVTWFLVRDVYWAWPREGRITEAGWLFHWLCAGLRPSPPWISVQMSPPRRIFSWLSHLSRSPSLVILHSPLLHSCPQSILNTKVKLCGRYHQSSLARGLGIRLYQQEALAAGRRVGGGGWVISYLLPLHAASWCWLWAHPSATVPAQWPFLQSCSSQWTLATAFLLLALDRCSLPLLVSGTRTALVASVSAAHTPGRYSIWMEFSFLLGSQIDFPS